MKIARGAGNWQKQEEQMLSLSRMLQAGSVLSQKGKIQLLLEYWALDAVDNQNKVVTSFQIKVLWHSQMRIVGDTNVHVKWRRSWCDGYNRRKWTR